MPAAEASLTAYSDFVCERANFDVEVTSPSEVRATPKAGNEGMASTLPALFHIEMVAKDAEGIEYRMEPSAYVAAVLAVYDRAAASVQDIPQLEKFVMEDLFWSDTPMLQTISTHEGVPPVARARFQAALEAAVPPMLAYLDLYAPYLPVVQLDVAAHMEEYAAAEKTIAEMKADVVPLISPLCALAPP